MWPAMDYPSVPALQANALFASALQRSDEPSTSQIRQAVAAAISALGFPGGAGRDGASPGAWSRSRRHHRKLGGPLSSPADAS